MKIRWLIEGSITNVREIYHGLFDQHGRPIKTDSQTDENQNGVIPSPLSPLNEAQCASGQNSPTHKWHDIYNDPQVCFTALAFVIGLIACGIYYFQLKATQGQLAVMQAQITTMTNQTAIMQGQLAEMQIARIQEQRAWVFTAIPDNALTVYPNSGIITAIIKNVGKTPALVTSSYANITANINDIKKHDPIGSNNPVMLIPERNGAIKMAISPLIEAQIFQGVPMYVYGTVYYSDISSNAHWSQFCFKFADNGHKMEPTGLHDSCDDLDKQNPH